MAQISCITKADMSDYKTLINTTMTLEDPQLKDQNLDTILRLLWTTAYNKGCRRAADPY